ncbi:MAG: hypothetical protein ABR577_15185 [Pyrinomonadaceae bacterium]
MANRKDEQGRLSVEGNVFSGRLPEDVNIANTASSWAGVLWAMIIWPLPEDKYTRAQLLAHESWHRVQTGLGLAGSMPANNHLDSTDGRIWLQLEWRALANALIHRGTLRLEALKDALLFRAYRRTLFEEASAQERALEMNEGLAEYTGIKLSGRPDVNAYVATQLKEAGKKETFVRSFAYASGAAYGILLDEAGAKWRANLTSAQDLGSLLQSALAIKLPPNIKDEAARASAKYGGSALIAAETGRENHRRKRLAAYRALLIEGHRLEIPLRRMSLQFNPNNLLPLDALGTIYPDIRIVDAWGILNVTKGALLNASFTKVYVPAPTDSNAPLIRGDGWTLSLNPGWTIKSGTRTGDYVLQKDVPSQIPR